MSDCLAVRRDPKAEISMARRESTDDIDATMADCSSMLASGIGSAHRSDGCVVDLVLYRATIPLTKQPRPFRVAELRWVAPQELENYAFPPADQATTNLLLNINRDAHLAGETPAQVEDAQGQERVVNESAGSLTAY